MERKYRAFAFTVRQKAGTKVETIEAFKSFIQKKDGGFAVLEGEGDTLHLHAGVFIENETSKSNFNLQLQRIYEKVKEDDDSVKVLRGGTRIMYDMNFFNEYLQKEDEPRVIYECIPEEVDKYFPPEEEQRKAKLSLTDSVLSDYEFLLNEREPDLKSDHLEFALYDIWFKDKVRKAPREKRKKRELQNDLAKWMWPEEFGPDW